MPARRPLFEPMFSPEQVAERMNHSKQWVFKKLRSGEIKPFFKLSENDIRIPQSALDSFLQNKMIE